MEDVPVEDVNETKESLKKVPLMSAPVAELFSKLRKNIKDEKLNTLKVFSMVSL